MLATRCLMFARSRRFGIVKSQGLVARVRSSYYIGNLSTRSSLYLLSRQPSSRTRLNFPRSFNLSLPFIPSSNFRIWNVFSKHGWKSSGSSNYWWSWWEKLVKSVNRRCLLCAGAIFLWDRERITNQELSKSLSKYEKRISGKVSTENNVLPNVSAEQEPSLKQETSSTSDSTDVKNQANNDSTTKSDCPPSSNNSTKLKSRHHATKSKLRRRKTSAEKKSQEEHNDSNETSVNHDNKIPDQVSKEKSETTVSTPLHLQNEDKEDSISSWQLVSEQDNCTVYSKPYGDSGLCQYKVIGHYSDITARDFLDVQVSDDRKSWDSYCLSLKTIDRDSSTGSEVIHWVTKFPFPMTNRDYVFVRRYWISPDDTAIVIINRAVEHQSVPETRKYVRVKSYFSETVIKPTTFIDEIGFNYELTYFDDPGSYISSTAMNWVTKSAMPDYLNKIYKAALAKQVTNGHTKHLV